MNCYLYYEYLLLVYLNIIFCILKFWDLNNKCYCFVLFFLLIVKIYIYKWIMYIYSDLMLLYVMFVLGLGNIVL